MGVQKKHWKIIAISVGVLVTLVALIVVVVLVADDDDGDNEDFDPVPGMHSSGVEISLIFFFHPADPRGIT